MSNEKNLTETSETKSSKANGHCGCRAGGACRCGASCACESCPCERGKCHQK